MATINLHYNVPDYLRTSDPDPVNVETKVWEHPSLKDTVIVRFVSRKEGDVVLFLSPEQYQSVRQQFIDSPLDAIYAEAQEEARQEEAQQEQEVAA